MTYPTLDLDQPSTQAGFGQLVGISQAAVSGLVDRGVLKPGESTGAWLLAYTARLREQAAGRDVDGSLSRERTALARAQRLGQEIKNAQAQGEWAPIGLLGDVLALASAAIVDRLDALPGALRKACPDLSAQARDTIAKTIASARNEWIRSTCALVDKELAELGDPTDTDAELDASEPALEQFDDLDLDPRPHGHQP